VPLREFFLLSVFAWVILGGLARAAPVDPKERN
jgi:hypothetical protein